MVLSQVFLYCIIIKIKLFIISLFFIFSFKEMIDSSNVLIIEANLLYFLFKNNYIFKYYCYIYDNIYNSIIINY